jgi:GR25 family glycosyltransferase involved in LPS biosynthesis
MQQTVPAIVINLDRSSDRLEHMAAQFARAGMSFKRFPAVDGTALPEGVRPYFCDASAKIVSPLRPGEIGCYASHLALWQEVAAGRHGQAVLVCEDDMVLPQGFAALIRSLMAVAPQGWDLIRLSPRTKRAVVPVCRVDSSHQLVRYSRQPGSSAAYLLSLDGARKLLSAGIRHNPLDQDFKRPWAYSIDSYGVWPPLPEKTNVRSTIDERGGRARSARRWRSLVLGDAVNKLLYQLSTLGLARWTQCLWQNAARKFAEAGLWAATSSGASTRRRPGMEAFTPREGAPRSTR